MTIFDYEADQKLKKEAPLASRFRPETLEDFIGQEHIVGQGTLLYRAIKADRLTSIILFGPPGTGKTTLAKVIANTTKSDFRTLNATTSGKSDIKETVENARRELGTTGKRTILFIDEIHRFNKTQQDTLLPFVEDGTVILIGATTENPFFEVNKALISRSTVFKLEPHTKDSLKSLIKRAILDEERGLGKFNIEITDDALDFLADAANGDARTALNAIELAALTTEPRASSGIYVDIKVAEQCIRRRALGYDKTGDSHYDTISAFIKSMRGSDPDATMYYLARMLYAGEDPKFIARRIVICASEDVGNADPHALMVATSAMTATDFIGLPECRLNLAQAALYIACAPKSNAVLDAIEKSSRDVANIQVKSIPLHLKNANYAGEKALGHGVGYKYSHAYENNYVPQQYLPDELKGKIYYKPTENGVEKKIKESLKRIRGGDNFNN